MPDQRECDQIRSSIDELKKETRKESKELWRELDKTRSLLTGDGELEKSILWIIATTSTVVKGLVENEKSRSKKEWMIICLIITQFIYIVMTK